MHRSRGWWERDTAAGIVLALSALVSFALVNSAVASSFEQLLHTVLFELVLGDVRLAFDLLHLINDGLMAVFFFYVGLELKRETVEGPLRNPRAAALPIAAAIGGMAAPALVYLALIQGADPVYARGWAVPAATDIAFALGVLSLIGRRVPSGLRLFLLALAIVDDLGAILIIAIFYTSSISGWALGAMAMTYGAMLVCNRTGVRALWIYGALGALLWAFTLMSGVHATIAGVLAASTIPMRDTTGASPLKAVEHALKPFVVLLILPAFAIANAGAPVLNISADALSHPVLLAGGLGLLVGKPLGVAGVTLVAAGFMHRILPAPPLAMVGAGFIAGVGFTMSLFIGVLAFGDGEAATPMRIGVIGGSFTAAAIGLLLIALSNKRNGGDPDLSALSGSTTRCSRNRFRPRSHPAIRSFVPT
jgi:Na+:H+ antiporter, NhaA family